ncbi:protein-disulfide reductase DsbD [Saccharospirillum mangrovi]|uniref:protein-disulfide reductase DsbD n=1 Tax=Saccharospirillum mangrovi TaxID=2161747 RepID=UPI0013005F7F|nr:protein-disulfide reductase DsbD [Saccharospirillum mangrovi]
MKSAAVAWAVLLSAVMSLLAPLSQAEEFLPPDQAFQPNVVVDAESAALRLHWDIADGYYLYKSRVQVSLNGQPSELIFDSESELKQDPNFGPMDVFHHEMALHTALPATSADTYEMTLTYQGCAEAGLCYPPQTKRMSLENPGLANPGLVNTTNAPSIAAPATSGLDSANNATGLASWMADASLVWILGTFFVLGLGLTFTPCVLPMVPILAGIIAGQGEQISARKGASLSLAYVLGMATTYTLAGVLVGFFGARLNLQTALQNPIALSIFAGIFVVLSLAMFGFYELQMPSFIRNRLGQMDTGSARSGIARYGSVALMGLVSALVVSPCVSAPLAGTLIYISTTGDALLGGSALFMLSLGMGAPLLLVGAGGGRLLPKAGMWMIAVKQFFGVVLLGIAITLVSRFLPGAVSLALWGLLILVYAAQLGLGGEAQTGWQKTRRGIAAAMGIYSGALLIGALAGQTDPLQPLAGLGAGRSGVAAEQGVAPALFERIADVAELNRQMAIAQQSGEAVVLDLYADWCTACQDMERAVFEHETGNYSGQIRFLQLDVTRNSDAHVNFLESHKLFGPPALLYYNAQGNEAAGLRTLGEIDFEQWRGQLASLLSDDDRTL